MCHAALNFSEMQSEFALLGRNLMKVFMTAELLVGRTSQRLLGSPALVPSGAISGWIEFYPATTLFGAFPHLSVPNTLNPKPSCNS